MSITQVLHNPLGHFVVFYKKNLLAKDLFTEWLIAYSCHSAILIQSEIRTDDNGDLVYIFFEDVGLSTICFNYIKNNLPE